jgi:lipopolysaccharide assembly protein A
LTVRIIRTLTTVIVLIVTLMAGVLFALQNTTPVPLDLLLVQLPERTMAVWLLLALVIGVLLGLVGGSLMLLRQRGQLASLRRQKQRLAVEVDRLRKVGLTESE